MWVLLKAVLKEEVSRFWRRLLKRPDPPNPYTEFRLHRETSLTTQEPKPTPPSE